ncbi:MAG: sulfotransferase family protein [Panacibacter sp.]
MSLKVIGAGFGRTGTMSTYHALTQLGFPCYHMQEVILNKENKTHVDFWNAVANAPEGQQHNWEEVFQNYTAAVDNPACCVWKELMVAYPEAKVLLTLHPRGAEAWYDSTIDTIYFTETLWQFKVLKAVISMMRKFGNMSTKLIWQRSHKGTMSSKAAAIARYQQHVEEVKSSVLPERLLIFTVTEGWEPLCNFLGVEIPSTDFPNVNDRAEVKKTIADFTKGAYITLAIGIAVVITIVFILIKIFA